MKKSIALVLALCLMLSLLPMTAFAAGVEHGTASCQAAPQALPENPVETNGDYTVSVSYTGPGSVNLHSTSANAYDTVYMMANPDPGYIADVKIEFYYYWHKADIVYIGNDMYALDMSDGDCHIYVNFIPASGDFHKVNLTTLTGGTARLNQDKAKQEESVIVNIAANPGYEFAGVEAYTASGSRVTLYDVGSEDNIVVELFMPAEDVSITVGFERTGNPFVDVKESDFFYDSVMWAVDNGVTNGTDTTHFSPLGLCNRAQVVTFLWRAFGSPAPTSRNNPFTDVPSGTWYTDAVLWALERGITTGTDTNTFSPNQICNRAQVVTFLWRAFGRPAPASRNNPFTDVPGGTWYTDAVLWALENEITTGTSATTFNPNGDCMRAHVVTFLYRTYLMQN